MIDVKHIAKLANLKLSEGEIKDYSDKLTDTLKYIDILKQIPTENIDPTAQVSNETNHWREDEIDKNRILPPSGPYKAKLTWTN
ncbi:MAG: Asp-tRNA(Asn)/Glu-tRNA(Gln) amidotransferase subunit GatC [Patescibacteria group bacterium]